MIATFKKYDQLISILSRNVLSVPPLADMCLSPKLDLCLKKSNHIAV